jgi:hypothetical protein
VWRSTTLHSGNQCSQDTSSSTNRKQKAQALSQWPPWILSFIHTTKGFFHSLTQEDIMRGLGMGLEFHGIWHRIFLCFFLASYTHHTHIS